METLVVDFKITPFWDEEYKLLDYEIEPFNNLIDINRWLAYGYSSKFTGQMCDMRRKQPSWNYKFIEYFDQLGWKNIGTSYYRMTTGTILPQHQDTYKKYINLFNLKNKEQTIRRAVIFLENWKSGHYLELDGNPIVNWSAGDTVVWKYDLPHMAANMGLEDRYTLQITGHIDAD